MQSHLFISDSDGALYDTRAAQWSTLPPLRAPYRVHKTRIESTADLRAALRAGSHTDLGGYPLFFVTSTGDALSFDSVRENLPECLHAIAYPLHADRDWQIVALEINYEDSDLHCAHSGKAIESAYGSDDNGE